MVSFTMFYNVFQPQVVQVWISNGLTAAEIESNLASWWESRGEDLIKNRWGTAAAASEDSDWQDWCHFVSTYCVSFFHLEVS